MADKPTTTNIASGAQYDAATLNANFSTIEDAIEGCLGRGGTSESPNSMSGDLDMDLNDILNVQQVQAGSLVLGGVLLTTPEPVVYSTDIPSTVSGLKVLDLSAGALVWTKGYYSSGDGGQGTYLIEPIPAVADGYIDHQLVNGTVARLQYDTALNIKQAGAVNGASDSYASIQAAIDYVEAINGRLHIPYGVYSYETGLTITEAITITGDDERGSILKKNGDFVGITTTKGITISDLTVDSYGGSDTSQGIHITSATYRTRMKNVTVVNQGSNGVEIFSSNLGTYEDLTILNNGGDGILLNGNSTPDVNGTVFKNIDTRGNAGWGFNIENGWNVFGYGVSAQSNGNGIRLNNSRGSRLEVYAENNTGEQIELTNHSNCKGSFIHILFGSYTDNSTGFNAILSSRRGSVYDPNYSQVTLDELRFPSILQDGTAVLGSAIFDHPADKVYNFTTSATGVDQTLNFLNSESGRVLDVTFDGDLTCRSIVAAEQTLDIDSTAPNVSGGNVFITANTVATSINQLIGGTSGQKVTIIFNDTNTTMVSSTVIRLASASFVASVRDTMELVYSPTTSDWHEVSRSVNS